MLRNKTASLWHINKPGYRSSSPSGVRLICVFSPGNTGKKIAFSPSVWKGSPFQCKESCGDQGIYTKQVQEYLCIVQQWTREILSFYGSHTPYFALSAKLVLFHGLPSINGLRRSLRIQSRASSTGFPAVQVQCLLAAGLCRWWQMTAAGYCKLWWERFV